jgi:hypothetical protein
MTTFTLIIYDAPVAKERALTALRFAWTADLEGHKVNLWLFENGVYLAKKNQKPAQGLTNYGQMLEDLVKRCRSKSLRCLGRITRSSPNIINRRRQLQPYMNLLIGHQIVTYNNVLKGLL